MSGSPNHELNDVLLITTRGSARHITMVQRILSAGLSKLLVLVEAFKGHSAARCLSNLHSADPTVAYYNRSSPVVACGLPEARSLHVSPPIDPWIAWPGTRWIGGQLQSDHELRPGADHLASNVWRNGVWGQFGVAVSHARAWSLLASRQKASDDHRFSLILEDDVVFAVVEPPGAKHWYDMLKRSILPAIPHDVDFVYIGSCQPQHRPNESLLRPARRWCLHGYALTPRGARRLLSEMAKSHFVGVRERSAHPHGVSGRWRVRSGVRVPIDFVTKWHSDQWLHSHDVNEARAAADGIVSRECLSARADRSGGLIWQDRSLGSCIHTGQCMLDSEEPSGGSQERCGVAELNVNRQLGAM